MIKWFALFVHKCLYPNAFGGCSLFNHDFQGASPSDNIDEWKRKLTMLLCDKEKQELVSREKKDRRDFEQIAVLASKMGLYRYFCILSYSFLNIK